MNLKDEPLGGTARIAVAAQRAVILLTVGDVAGWQAVSDIPRGGTTVDEKLQLVRGYHNLALAVLDLGEYRRAESFLADAGRIQGSVNHVWWDLWLQGARISVDKGLGRWTGLESRVRRLIEVETPDVSSGNQIVLGGLLLARGQLEEAERCFEAAFAIARSAESISALAQASSGLGRVRVARGNLESACQVLALGFDAIKRKGIWPLAAKVAPVAAEAFRVGHDRASVDALLRTVTASLAGRDPATRAALAYCHGALAETAGRWPAASRYFAQAERLWAQLPDPYQATQARERGGRCLLHTQRAEAADALLGAHDTFASLGAIWDAARVRVELRTHGIPLPYPWRGGRRGFGEALSPQEEQVARLAGAGRTNREIAEALFISRRTAEGHVAAVLRKLGVTSRRDLASSG